MKPEAPLPCSQDPINGPYTEPHECSQQPHTRFPFQVPLNIILPFTSRSLDFFFSGFLTKILYAFLTPPLYERPSLNQEHCLIYIREARTLHLDLITCYLDIFLFHSVRYR